MNIRYRAVTRLSLVICAVLAVIIPLAYEPAAAELTQARSADAFVDSIGVVTHVSYTRTEYWGSWERTKSALVALGVRHFRDGVTDCTSPASKMFCRHLQELGQAGMKGDFVTGLKIPMNVVSAFPAQVPDAFDSFEGPNEVDLSRQPNWVARLAAYQQLLYTTVKANPALAKYPVIGPAIGHINHFAEAGDLSAYFDYGNLHNYLHPDNPGTHASGRIDQWITKARAGNPGKPFITTETGYWDGPPGKGLPDAVIARYVPRLFLEQFEEGILRTFEYELLDEGDPSGIYSHAGLMTTDVRPKPQYEALKNVIAVLKDPGPAFTPGTLDYQIDGMTPQLDQMLLGKRDGSMYLVLWLESPSYDPRAQRAIDVPTRRLRITVNGRSLAGARTITFDDAGAVRNEPIVFRDGAATVKVGDQVVIVTLPARS